MTLLIERTLQLAQLCARQERAGVKGQVDLLPFFPLCIKLGHLDRSHWLRHQISAVDQRLLHLLELVVQPNKTAFIGLSSLL